MTLEDPTHDTQRLHHPARCRCAAALLAAVAAAAVPVAAPAAAETPSACATRGNWIDVRTGQSLDRGDLFRDLAAEPSVVLLGESHVAADDHRWQLHTLAALHGRGTPVVIGFEAFPRRLQAVLDDWVEDRLTEDAFLKASEWHEVWGYDAALYMPLFEFARLNHIPMVALNVERRLVSRVAEQGWDSIPAAEREGLSDPAPADTVYQRDLARVFLFKKTLSPSADPLSAAARATPEEPSEATLADTLGHPDFQRFIAAQLTWDRAMAEALADARRRFPDAAVVAILGSGHVEGGHGVPHQLQALGVARVRSFLTAATDTACTVIGTRVADAIFTVPREDTGAPPPDRPRLGILLTGGGDAPRITRVVHDSVAELAGLKAGDEVLRAAGIAVRTPAELIEVVTRQAPGTWLPMSIRRDGEEIGAVAKFPPPPEREPQGR